MSTKQFSSKNITGFFFKLVWSLTACGSKNAKIEVLKRNTASALQVEYA